MENKNGNQISRSVIVDKIDPYGLMKKKKTTRSSSYNRRNVCEVIEVLPPLDAHAHISEQENLFIKKLRLCSNCFNFEDALVDIKPKEIKRDTLNELVTFISSDEFVLSDKLYPEVISMVASNIFRPLPSSEFSDSVGDDDDPVVDSSWPHLVLVYEFFLRFLDLDDFKPSIAKKFINERFVLDVLSLFNSEDGQERDFLKTIIHRIYAKILSLRIYIRRQITYIFLMFIYENERFNGINEILAFLMSIINGFQVPVKEQHKSFLMNVLLPLYKVENLSKFSYNLNICLSQYLEKDPSLADAIVKKLLKFWPKRSAEKEVVFIQFFEEFFQTVRHKEFRQVCVPVFKKLTDCFRSNHFEVAFKSLSLLHLDATIDHVEDNLSLLLPIVFDSLVELEHWNDSVTLLAKQVLNTLEQLDPKLFKVLTDEWKKRKESSESSSKLINEQITKGVTLLAVVGVAIGQYGGEGDGHDEHKVIDYYSPPHYKYEYSVFDSHTHDIKKQEEERKDDVVKGYYSLKEADGTTREVHYTSDKHNGFNAVVHREGHASHPQKYGHSDEAYHSHGENGEAVSSHSFTGHF